MSQLISQDSHDLKLKKPHKKSVDNKEKTEIKKSLIKYKKEEAVLYLTIKNRKSQERRTHLLPQMY